LRRLLSFPTRRSSDLPVQFFSEPTAMQTSLQNLIESAWEDRSSLRRWQFPSDLADAVEQTIQGVDDGSLRGAEKIDGQWQVHQWVEKAVLLSFRLAGNSVVGQAPHLYYGKVLLKFQ